MYERNCIAESGRTMMDVMDSAFNDGELSQEEVHELLAAGRGLMVGA